MIKQYAIYENPDDFPAGYVVREWLIDGETILPGDGHRAATLDEAHELLPDGVVLIELDDPDPHIIEVWI